MNEEALNDAYTLFISEGYNGTLDEFKVLINQNQNALNDSYKLFQREGYNDSFVDFQNLLGVKKKTAKNQMGIPSWKLVYWIPKMRRLTHLPLRLNLF